ncbi:MAG: cobalamin biosynthesis protein CobW [Alphaproteobacteria bacterium RIFOXYD12_FULL_60_8]|nr:MAG: cobalamin biosynthesis protein CobW [Alphaproteobacteria bacterium RIFOXYD12_FULL_60_8]
MKRLAKIPATVITGFLGAGKTTLIRHLLEYAGGRRLALIINEFGDIGVDRNLLTGCGIKACAEEDIVELANGCLCCTVADEFLPALEALLSRPNPPDHIVIETSGLALPKPLVKAFGWPDVRAKVTVDGVIAVVDAKAFAQGRFADVPLGEHPDNPLEEVFTDQLHCADMVLVNKTDLLDVTEKKAVLAELRGRLRPGVHLVPTAHGAVDIEVLLGLDARAEDDLSARPSHHDDADGHDHDDFTSFAVNLPAIADPAGLEERLRHAIATHDILRIKGFFDVPGKPLRGVVQAVGARLQRGFDRPWREGEARRSHLVVIGLKGLDEGAVTAALTG